MKFKLFFWSLSVFIGIMIGGVYGGQLTSVSVSPGNNQAGAFAIYTFTFTTSDTGNGTRVGIPADGKIVITFPAGFNMAEVEIASSTNTSVLNGGLTASGIGSVITVIRDSTGTAVAGDTTVGIKVGIIKNHTLVAANYAVTIETQMKNGTIIDSGTSATFSIIHSTLASFRFLTIFDQIAGTNFGVTITAVDQYNNTVTSFTGIASLSDLTGTILPDTTTNFITGVWNGSVRITKTHSNNKIIVKAQDKAGTSNAFIVNPAALDHFSFQTISSPQTAGTAFNITITAEDAYNNRVTTFTNSTTLLDNTGTIAPTTTGAFSSGQWTDKVTITRRQTDVRITASANGITSHSSYFNMQAANPHHFVINTISSQSAGMPFLIEVIAKDQFNNQVDQFDATVDLLDLTGTITPTVSDSFSLGYWAGNVTVTQAYTNNIITVKRTATGLEEGTSNGFNVVHNSLDHFVFTPVPNNQTAGNAFSVTIAARDAYDNAVMNFTGTANLSDITGTISPGITGSFISGNWNGNVTITKSQASNRISATSGSKTGTSNSFNVTPQNLDHFRFQTVSSPQLANQPFQITITAEDIYNNRVTNFTNTVNLSDATTTIFPTATGNFSTGQWTGSVTITKSQNDVTITATRSTTTGESNPFNVQPGSLDHFSLATIGTKAAGVPFAIAVTAQDFHNNRVTGFNGTVTIQDLTGKISPTSSGAFDLGQWSGDVTITQVITSDRLTVTNTSGPQSGSSNNFDVVAGNIDHFEISNIASPITAGIPFSVTITAKDANNATVTGYTGTANINDLTGTTNPNVTSNFINGEWTGDLTNTKSYTNNQITVSGAGKSGNSNLFNVQANSVTHFSFNTITSPRIAGQAFSITITARDAYENIAVSFVNTINLSDNTNTINPAVTTNFSSGHWTGDVTITKAQNDVEIAASQGGASGLSNKFNLQAASLNHFTIGNISTQQSNVPFSISVTAEDQYNNIATQFTGKVNISDQTGTISPVASGNFSSGQWTGSVTISQSYTNNAITVVNQGGSESGNSNSFDLISSTIDHFVIATIGNQVAGQAFSLTIRAEDKADNLVTNFTGTASLSDLTGTITPNTTGNFAGGQWTGNVIITKSRVANTITVTSGGKAGTSNTFNVEHSNLDHFQFQTISSPQVAGQSFSITITARDIYNNQVNSFNNAVDLSDPTGTIAPATTGNFTSGQWTGNVQIIKSQNDVTITATGLTTTGKSNAFNVGPAFLNHFFLATIGTQAAGVPFNIRITAQDLYNNGVTGFNGTVIIQDLTGTIAPTTSGAFNMGQWSGNVTITQVITDDKITVTNSSGPQTGSSNNFNVVAGNIDHFEVATISSPQTAGVPFGVTITAKDVNNATVTSYTGTANLSDLSGSLNPVVTSNFVNGVWTGNLTITRSYTDNKITVSGAGKSGASNSFNVQSNSLTHFIFNTITSPKTAGQSFPITIIAKDNYDNQVTTFSGTVNLLDNTNTISPTITPNFASGQWTGNVTITRAQNDVEITATQGSSNGTSNKFNVQSAILHHFLINNISTQQSNVPFGITITAQDQHNNIATPFTGRVNISDKTNTMTPTTSDNFSNGQWSGNVSISQSYTSNQITVVRQGGTETGSSNTFNVTSSGVDHFVISAIGSQIAGVPFSIAIQAEDAANNLVTGFTGTVSISDLTSSISPKTSGSFTAGQWMGNVTITRSKTGDTISATSGGKAGTSNPFNVDPAALDHFRLTPIGSPQTAGTPFSITVTAEDVYDNKVMGFTGSVNLSDNTGSITPITSGNFTNGQWTGNITISRTSADNVISVSGSGKSGQSNGFNVIAASLHHFVLEIITTQSAGQPFSITITAQDNYSNTATQFTGKVNISDKTNTISPTASGNFTSGKWTGNVVISQAYGNDVITVVRQGGGETGSSNSFDVISSNVDHFVISTIGNQTAGQPFNITIRAEDSNNNLVTSFSGNASLSDLTNTINPKTTGSFSGGQWSSSVTITMSKTGDTITATSSGKAGTSNSFNVNPAALDHYQISSIGSPQVAGQSFSITVTAEDVYNNKATGFTGSVNLSDNTNTLSPSVSNNFSNGEWTGLVNITKSYTDDIITVSGSGKSGQSNKFNVAANSLQRFVISMISTQAANQPFSITVTAQDNYNNTATQFTGKVNISDKTGTISPTSSGNFSSGKWTSNVVISQAYTSDVITVANQAGNESGTSNSFDVISSNVDHFVISSIGNQMAGTPFGIAIRAEDVSNNLVTSFAGTASLSDLTNTLTPTTTGNFTNGQWSGNVTITKSRIGNTITVTSSGKAGVSNAFNVSPAALDHFAFATINSPQVAGTSFEITIYARDIYENQVTSFTTYTNLSDGTNSISPAQTGNFTSGSWTGNVTITKSQTDVKITATQSSKTGQSNIFNINPGVLTSFQIANISTQGAGQPFTITVTALDAYLNVAIQFTGTVNISDLTGTITPVISHNFVNGKWTGNVTITQVRQNNRITVTNTGGAQTGQSNLFNVIASSVDHFDINAISSPQVAGVQFPITITARDAQNNVVTGFTGTALLSDLSGTISPTTTTNFVSGSWQDNVTITKSWTNDKITVTSSGKAGQSNSFNVNHSTLDHFEFNNISSPQTAGISFPITIQAKDIYSNIVTSYTSMVGLTDNTGTLLPPNTTNFTSGQWTGNVRITKKQNDVYIVASGTGKLGQSNYFNVKAGSLAYLKIRDTAGGAGQEVGVLNMALDDKITLYAAGYDGNYNFVRDVSASWRATGTLDQPLPAKGPSTVFDPKTPGTTGKIHADTTGVAPDSTGQITVGSIALVKIRTAPNGAGIELGDVTITADQNLALYCAGYDAGKNYIGDMNVQWRTIGTLLPAITDTGKVINFLPTKAPASGKIIADHLTAIDDSTGIINVVPGVPIGEIVLTPMPSVIPANGATTATIKSGEIKDADGNLVAKNTQFTVTTTLGTITTTDVNPMLQGIQIAANDSGKIQFTLKAATAGGTAYISVSSVNGSATGNTSVTISNLNLLSVSSSKTAVSQGQATVPVSVVVQNLGTSTVTNLSAGLIFKGPAPLFENRDADFPNVIRTDGVTNIPGGSTRTLTFNASVGATAKTDTVTVDSWISGQINTVTVNDTFAISKWKWAVQKPPQLKITKVYSLLSEVSQGRTGINVSMRVVNQGQASANVTLDTLSFWSVNAAKDVTGEYQIIPAPINPSIILGNGAIHQFDFSVSVSIAATLGPVTINGRINGTDVNSGIAIFDNTADTTHTWLVKPAPIVGIKQFSPSQSLVTKNQTMPWQLIMVIENRGGTSVKFDSAGASFFLAGKNVTSEYTVVKPTKFIKSQTNILSAGAIDTLKYSITRTGSSIGQVTIVARPYLKDLGSGNPIDIPETYAGVTVQAPADLRIVNLIPSQNSVTRNQGQDWNIKIVLLNEGGTDIAIDLLPTKTYLDFSTGNNFVIKRPGALNGGGVNLEAATTDTLTFIIDGTSMQTGPCIISARVLGRQTTSGDTTVATFQRTTPLIIEEPAAIKILAVVNRAPNPPFVNKGQVFPIYVTLENNGQDEIKEATVKMTSSGGSITTPLTAKFADIAGTGGRKEQIFSVKADSLTTTTEIFKVEIEKVEAQNTKEPAAVLYERSPDSTETVLIQTPATFQITNVLTPDTIRASQLEPWSIVVVVKNRGAASAMIQTPKIEDISIKVNNVDYRDYIILPPSALQGGGLILTGGRTDTLIYTVTTTGNKAGSASVEVLLQANDLNNQKLLIAPGRYEFFIRSSAAVQLFKTEPLCNNFDGEKGLVNRGQVFSIRVSVQNLGRNRVKNVVIELITSGGSIISQNQLTISSIEHNETRFVDFQISADPHQVNLNEVFTSKISSAIDDTGLPAVIDNTGDNKARIEVRDSAKLQLDTWTATGDSVYTINQKFNVKAKVTNLGDFPAPVDDSGLLRLFVPKDYRIIVAADTIAGSHGRLFKPGEILEWSILTPEYASGPDTLLVSIENIPFDKNLNQRASVIKQHDSLTVQTLASNILYTTSIIEPAGAVDGIVSTYQEFKIQSVINYSENLKNVKATLAPPQGTPAYTLKSVADSTQDVRPLTPVKWIIRAPESKDNNFRTVTIKITATEKGNELKFLDTVRVKAVYRSNLEFKDVTGISFPESAKNGKISVGRPFAIKAEVQNTGIAKTIGTGELEINLGATGCRFADTSETAVKTFEVDSAVTWRLIAPDVLTSTSSISIRYLKRPEDENTDQEAYVEPNKERKEIPITTVKSGNINVAMYIHGPTGAKDSVLSSYQKFVIAANVNSFDINDLKAELILPGSFSFNEGVKPKQLLEPGESTVQWRVEAPHDSVSNNNLKVVCFGKDSHDENVTIVSDTISLPVTVVRRAEVKVTAAIIAPLEAIDGKVSFNQHFTVRAYMQKYGQAGFKTGPYKLVLSLPAGYTTGEDSIRTLTGDNSVEWLIKAPSQATSGENITVRVPPKDGPYDENSEEEVYFSQEIRRDIIPIITNPKIVKISRLENQTPNTVVKGQQQISMLGLIISNEKEGQFSNKVILNGFEILIKDRLGKPIEPPDQVIARIMVADYNQPETIYGQVTNFSTGSLIPIHLSQPVTISAGKSDSVDIIIDIAPEPGFDNVMISINADTNILLQEDLTFSKPQIQGEAPGGVLKLESDFCIIKGDNLKDVFGNYPNPFGHPERPITFVTYFLKEDTDVDIKIYTLIGELVWSRSYRADEPQGRKGTHDRDVIWDARNDQGYKVLNGVYIIYIKTGSGEDAMTKAAVVK